MEESGRWRRKRLRRNEWHSKCRVMSVRARGVSLVGMAKSLWLGSADGGRRMGRKARSEPKMDDASGAGG